MRATQRAFSDVPTGTSYTHTGLTTNTAYVYRVRSMDAANGTSGYSTADIASTRNFTSITAQVDLIQVAYLDELLATVNMVRDANGAPALAWTTPNFLPAGTPPPTVNGLIYAAHITVLRSAMNNALAAVFVPTTGYADDPLAGVVIKASHITDIRNRTN